MASEESAPAEIADAIRRIADDPEAARRMGCAGRQLALAEFTRKASASRFSDLFAGLKVPQTKSSLGPQN